MSRLIENRMLGRRRSPLHAHDDIHGIDGDNVDDDEPQQQQQQPPPPDARFSCSICTDAVMEPVVTHCGHLYCWSCLYRWLENGMTVQERNELFGFSALHSNNPYYDPSKRVCPVCRAPCSVKRVIPIYVRTDTTTAATAAVASSSSSSLPHHQSENETFTNRHNDETLNAVETVMSSSEDNDDNPVDVVVGNQNDNDDDGTADIGDDHPISSSSSSSLHATGLRNRSRIRSSISEASGMNPTSQLDDDVDEEHHNNHRSNPSPATVVPRRPVARSSSNLRLEERADVAAAAVFQQQQQNAVTGGTTTTAIATTRSASVSSQQQQQHHPASLAHGMLPLVQQAIRHASIVAGASSMNHHHQNNDYVPPLHRLEGMHQNNSQNSQQNPQQYSNYGISMDHDHTSPDFLAWILLLLGIFVLACLILF